MSRVDRHDPQPLPTSHLQPSAGSTRARGAEPARGAATQTNVAHGIGDAEGYERSRELLCRRVPTIIVPAALPKSP